MLCLCVLVMLRGGIHIAIKYVVSLALYSQKKAEKDQWKIIF